MATPSHHPSFDDPVFGPRSRRNELIDHRAAASPVLWVAAALSLMMLLLLFASFVMWLFRF